MLKIENSTYKVSCVNQSYGKLVKDRTGSPYLFYDGNLIPIQLENADFDKPNKPISYKRLIKSGDEVKTLFGLINKDGLAVTAAVYTCIKILENGYALVSIFDDCYDRFGNIEEEKCCEINESGFPLINGFPVHSCYFIKPLRHHSNFCLCWKNEKLGVANRFGQLLLPCIYDSVRFHFDCNACYLTDGDHTFTALLDEKGSVFNIIRGHPLLNQYYGKYLIAGWDNPNRTYSLLDYGGINIFEEEFSDMEFLNEELIAVNKEKKWSVYRLLILQHYDLNTRYSLLLSGCDEVLYGYGVVDNVKVQYIVVNNSDEANLYILKGLNAKKVISAKQKKILFTAEVYDLLSREFQPIENNYFIIKDNDRMTIYNIKGEKEINITMPAFCKRLLSYSIGDGLIGFESLKGQEGYMDYYGNIVIPANFDFVGPFINGKATVQRRFTEFSSYADDDTVSREENTAVYIIDKNRHIIENKTQYIFSRITPDDDMGRDNYRTSLDDAMEGDSDAYWNID